MSKPNMKKLVNPQDSIFEQIKRVDENGAEYWSARDMAKVLEYLEYRNFLPVIKKAKEACVNSQHKVQDHFEDDSIKHLESKEQRLLKDKKEERGE